MADRILQQAALNGLQAIWHERSPPSSAVNPCHIKCKYCKRLIDIDYDWIAGQNISGGNIFDLDCPHCWSLNTVTSIDSTRKLRGFRQRCENWLNPKTVISTRTPKKLRFEVLERDSFTCQYCGASPADGTSLHVDHKISAAEGGQTFLENLITACAGCNLGKGSRSVR